MFAKIHCLLVLRIDELFDGGQLFSIKSGDPIPEDDLLERDVLHVLAVLHPGEEVAVQVDSGLITALIKSPGFE